MLDFFKEGWLGNLFGICGILLAIYLYFRPLRVPKPKVMIKADHILTWRSGDLPSQFEIRFRGESIPRVGRSVIRFWNGGSGDLDFSAMRTTAPLKLELAGEGRFLDIAVLTTTRNSNNCRVRFDREQPSVAYLEFDFLAPGDGMLIGLLHTDSSAEPVMKGEFRDCNIRNVGNQDSDFSFDSIMKSSRLLTPKALVAVFFILGGALLFSSVLPLDALNFVRRTTGFSTFESTTEAFRFRVTMGFIGATYFGFALMHFWSKRRKYPRALVVPTPAVKT